MNSPDRKEEQLDLVRACLSVAERLYLDRREFYQPVFGWINGQFKKGTKPSTVLHCLLVLEKKEQGGNPANEVVGYLQGIMRSLEKEKESTSLRRGDSTTTGEILAECLRASEEMKGKAKGKSKK